MVDSLEEQAVMSKLRRNNHYLPICYQRGFTDASGRVWVKFPKLPDPKPLFPESIGKRRNLYIWTRHGTATDNVETFLDRKIERDFAVLSRRIKEEQNHFSNMTGTETGVLCRFVAAQTTRTLAHKYCVDQQAGQPVDTNTFVDAMLRKMHTIIARWSEQHPTIHFYTSLPLIEEQYITGDSPVLVIRINDNPVWVPVDTPQESITNLSDTLDSPRYCFMVPLSPYVCVSIQNWGDGNIHLPPFPVPPRDVRWLNALIRNQSKEFVIANRSEFLSNREAAQITDSKVESRSAVAP